MSRGKPDLAPWERALKDEAHRRKKQDTGVKLGHVYQAMAKQAGFNTYEALRASLAKLYDRNGPGDIAQAEGVLRKIREEHDEHA